MIEFDGEALVFAAIGLATLVAALLPKLVRNSPISLPMVFLAGGILVFTLLPDLPSPDPVAEHPIALHLTEICVIVALMGAGLAINRVPSWRTWSSTTRLLAITMPVSILAVAALGWLGLGLGVATALLLGAALAPTDPVLATEVQVSEPIVEQQDEDEEGDDDEARFALTSEAGLNDGLAFPFTYAAIAISLVGVAPAAWLGEWVLVDLLWRLAVGVGVGLGIGWMLGRLFFSGWAERRGFTEQSEGFVALACTFLAYGVAEVAEGYGFVAVFVCAVAIRQAERDHGYHRVMHTFVEQIERLLTMAVLVLLGGAIARGLFAGIGWAEVGFAAAVLLLVRPIIGWLSLTPGKTGPRERAVIAFFGVRGVGSLFYIAYALEHGDFVDPQQLWAIAGLVVVASIVVHGVAATPVMAFLDRRRERAARAADERTTNIAV